MQVRRFSADTKIKIPGGHPGLYGMLIAMNRRVMEAHHPDRKAFAAQVNGLPFELEAPVQIEAMYFDPQAHMEEHSAPHPIVLLVMEGSGFVRLGGPDGETRAVTGGDAVMWPAELDHTAWTDGEPLSAIVINLLPEEPVTPDAAL
jgi:quercetin dioxygenase-like cupin family protein